MPVNPSSPHSIIYMGSCLRDRNPKEIVWLDIPSFCDNRFGIGNTIDKFLDNLVYPNENLDPASLGSCPPKSKEVVI